MGKRGITVVVGQPSGPSQMTGVIAAGALWESVENVPVVGVYDRFPSASRASEFAEGIEALAGCRVVNPPWFTDLCRDKVRTQEVLERAGLSMPEVETDPAAFSRRLAEWGTGFLKPRHGSFGREVRWVSATDAAAWQSPPAEGGPWILQQAVLPPPNMAGVCVRVLVQRAADGGWVARTPVRRASVSDPVVNAARGADLSPLRDASHVHELALMAAAALANGDPDVVEAGVDGVIDEAGRPHLIEVNSRPRGRLRALAERWPDAFHAEHVQACMAPLTALCR
ncbi:MAG: RimK family alpha-L-glutamate ligase [Myxococcota bacterium]